MQAGTDNAGEEEEVARRVGSVHGTASGLYLFFLAQLSFLRQATEYFVSTRTLNFHDDALGIEPSC